MGRIAPDANDVFVLYLDDPAGTHSNLGSAGSSGDFVDYGNPISGVQGLLGDAMYIPSSFISSTRDGAGGANDILVTPNISMSGWIYPRRNMNFYGEAWNKQYYLNGWSSPYMSFGVQFNNSSDGGWAFYVTTSGILRTINFTASTLTGYQMMTAGRWYHVGGTYDGTTMNVYLNGTLISTSVPTGGNIDYYSGSRGQWYTGGIPGTGTSQDGCIIVQDIRIADVIRPQSYFADIYYNGMFVNG